MDTAKTPAGLIKFQEDFNLKMKVVSDSFQRYRKIADKFVESKASEKKILKYSKYQMVIENQDTKEKKNIKFEAFTEGNKIFFNPDAFFKYQTNKLTAK